MITPSPAHCTPCVVTPPQAVRFPAAASVVTPTSLSPVWLSYQDALPDHRQQLLVLVRQILQAAYPALHEQQWVKALEELQLPLCLSGEEVVLDCEGVATLVQHLVTCYPNVPTGDVFVSPVPLPSNEGQKPAKQTFSIPAGLTLQLRRVGYWKRADYAWLVNQALAQLLGQYPEAAVPTPYE